MERIVDGDLEDIINLYQKYLNDGHGVKRYLRNLFNKHSYLGYKETDNGKIVGMVLLEKGLVFTVPHKELEEKILSLANGKQIYSTSAVVVLEEYRHKNLGANLSKACLSDIKNSKVVVELWMLPNGDIPARFFKTQFGEYTDLGVQKNFYKNAYKHDIYCPICKTHCTCSAQIIMLDS